MKKTVKKAVTKKKTVRAKKPERVLKTSTLKALAKPPELDGLTIEQWRARSQELEEKNADQRTTLENLRAIHESTKGKLTAAVEAHLLAAEQVKTGLERVNQLNDELEAATAPRGLDKSADMGTPPDEGTDEGSDQKRIAKSIEDNSPSDGAMQNSASGNNSIDGPADQMTETNNPV